MKMQRKAAYNVLELNESASKEEIKKKYRILCKLFHPDRNPSIEAKQRYLQVQEAYECLMAEENREKQTEIFYYKAPAFQTTGKIIGGNKRAREQQKSQEETSKKLRQERHKKLLEQEEKKKRELEKRLAARKLPSEREAEKRRKLEMQKEAARIADIIHKLMLMDRSNESNT